MKVIVRKRVNFYKVLKCILDDSIVHSSNVFERLTLSAKNYLQQRTNAI